MEILTFIAFVLLTLGFILFAHEADWRVVKHRLEDYWHALTHHIRKWRRK